MVLLVAAGEAELKKGLCTDLSNGHCSTQDMTGKETQDFQVRHEEGLSDREFQMRHLQKS